MKKEQFVNDILENVIADRDIRYPVIISDIETFLYDIINLSKCWDVVDIRALRGKTNNNTGRTIRVRSVRYDYTTDYDEIVNQAAKFIDEVILTVASQPQNSDRYRFQHFVLCFYSLVELNFIHNIDTHKNSLCFKTKFDVEEWF